MLSFQPVMSASVMDDMIHNDKKYPSDYTSVENCIEMQVGDERHTHQTKPLLKTVLRCR